MADQISMTDVLFPEYKEGADVAEYLKQTSDYLFLLREGLMYTLDNLGIANFNASQYEALTNDIREPLTVKITEHDEAMLQLSLQASGITGRLDNFNGESATFEATVSGIKSSVTSLTTTTSGLSASMSSLSQTVSSLSGTVSTVSGNYISKAAATLTSAAFELTIQNYTGSTATTSQMYFNKDGLTMKYLSSGNYNTAVKIDKDGLTVYEGKIRIKNGSGTDVFYADASGNLTMTGTITGSNIFGSGFYTCESAAAINSSQCISISDAMISSLNNGTRYGFHCASMGQSSYFGLAYGGSMKFLVNYDPSQYLVGISCPDGVEMYTGSCSFGMGTNMFFNSSGCSLALNGNGDASLSATNIYLAGNVYINGVLQ